MLRNMVQFEDQQVLCTCFRESILLHGICFSYDPGFLLYCAHFNRCTRTVPLLDPYTHVQVQSFMDVLLDQSFGCFKLQHIQTTFRITQNAIIRICVVLQRVLFKINGIWNQLMMLSPISRCCANHNTVNGQYQDLVGLITTTISGVKSQKA